ncbi:MAG: hypothetical protein AB3N28_04330 [Kordiimonas sp.]
MRQLEVTVLQNGEHFLHGTFDVSDEDYPIVVGLLKEVDMQREQAASMLSGYMHAKDVGKVTEEMGKLAMIATVFMMEEGETAIEIPLESQ